MQAQVVVTKYFVCLFLALFAVTQLPLYWVEYPDIADFLNHLARMHILLHLSESDVLQQYYTLRHSKIGTNLAMEVVVPLLAKGVSLMLALKIFASLTMLLLTSGAVALGRVLSGRISYLLLGVLFFTQNAMFQLGLLNYLFGLGLALWLLAAWIYMRNKSGLVRWIAFAWGSIIVYLCHLSAFGVYAVCVMGYEIALARMKSPLSTKPVLKSLLFPLTQFVPVVMLHMLASTSSGIYKQAPIDTSGFELPVVWIMSKLVLLIMSPSISVSGYSMGMAVFGFLLVFGLYVGFREGLLKLTASVKWMAGLLLLCIFLLPRNGFGSNLVDIRLVPALALVLWSGLHVPEGRTLNPKLLLGVIASVVTLISFETGREWMLRDVEYKSVRVALQQIPEGSRVASIQLNKPPNSGDISLHTGAFGVIDRSVLLSNMFIWPFQPFWVAYREPYASIVKPARLEDPANHVLPYQDVRRRYDYILVFGGTAIDRMQYAQNAETVFSSKSLRLIRTDLAHSALN